jgi:myotubularin-related protein 6/7/8
VGIKQNRSIQDEKLVEAIFQSHLSVDSPFALADPRSKPQKEGERIIYGATCTNVIIDARPTANAMANVAQGGGSENMENYKGGTGAGFGVTRKAYLGIENIHAMRDSLAKVVEALREADGPVDSSMDVFTSVDGVSSPDGMGMVDRQALRRSGWLKHLSAILQGMLIVVRTVHVASSHVLVHCSDGWDRTAQTTALAQLCLDPYFRTLRGFMVLIEKEWLSFGHKFLDRCGHLSSDKFFVGGSTNIERDLGDDGPAGGAGALIAGFRDRISNPARIREMAPVFHQFLECVRNIQRQYPDRFEFNELLLRNIYYHLMACEFGTFLFNCERERRVSLDGASSWSGIQKTKSVWEWFLCEENMKEGKWTNPTYNKGLDDVKTGTGDMGVLLPSAKDVRFWNEIYGRTDEEMNGKFVPAPPAPNPELKLVSEGMEEDVLTEGTMKGVRDLSLVNGSSVPSRNGTPILSTSASSSTGGFSLAGSISRNTSPVILAVDNTPPSPTAMITNSPGAAPRVDSFRPFTSTNSGFSLRTSPVPTSRLGNSLTSSSPPTASPLVTSSASTYSSLYERPPPPQQTYRSLEPNESTSGSGVQTFSTVSLTDGLAGLASNAGGGMKSIWGRLSSNANAAFSAVQDATKDYRGTSLTGYGGSTTTGSSRAGGSALGWGNDTWGATTSSPASATVSVASPWSTPATTQTDTSTIRPTPRFRTIDSLTGNPWSTPTPIASVKPRSLEEEWQTATVMRPPTIVAPSQAPLGGVLVEHNAPLAAPTPRHASALSPSSSLTVPLGSVRQTTLQDAPTQDKSSDPLGVGL